MSILRKNEGILICVISCVIWIVKFLGMVHIQNYLFSKVSMLGMDFFVEIFQNQNSTIPVTYKGPVFFFSIFAVSKIVLALIFTDKK